MNKKFHSNSFSFRSFGSERTFQILLKAFFSNFIPLPKQNEGYVSTGSMGFSQRITCVVRLSSCGDVSNLERLVRKISRFNFQK